MSDAFAALVQHALQGTSRQREAPLPEPLHTLFANQPEAPAEAHLLLAAGAAAVYATAGRLPHAAPELPAAAPEDSQPPCPPAVARLIGDFLAGRHTALLPEALALLRRAGFRLPPALLPPALSYRDAALRPALAAVLGERGRWLAAFNPAWQWALDAQPAAPDDAALAAAWQEGTAERRLNAIRRLRQLDPAKARDWIAATWRAETAELRSDLLRAVQPELSPTDEPLLEAALDDRAASVREEAARLLARLPSSAYARRMAERAVALLSVETLPTVAEIVPADVGALRSLRVSVTPPSSIDAAWERDGVSRQPPSDVGARAWWLRRVLASIDPAFWEVRFAALPTVLIAGFGTDQWAVAVLQGWTDAALLHRRASWAEPLWLRWYYDAPQGARPERWHELLALLPQAGAERLALLPLDQGADQADPRWAAALAALPHPWSVSFGLAYLRHLRGHFRALAAKGPVAFQDRWLGTLEFAALRLPPGCFAAALQPWDVPEGAGAYLNFWQQQIKRFTTTIDLRRQLWEGLRCSL